MSVLSGNLNDNLKNRPEYKGWFVGHFIDEPNLKTNGLEVRWITFKKNELKESIKAKFVSNTIVILIRGKFVVEFPNTGNEVVLSREGDYVYFDAGKDSHKNRALEDSLVVVVRWPSNPNNY